MYLRDYIYKDKNRSGTCYEWEKEDNELKHNIVTYQFALRYKLIMQNT